MALAGYRSYDSDLAKNKIELKQLNIIIGANGAGKSNFISFLELVSFMMTRGLRTYVSRQGGAHTLMYFGPNQTEKICGEISLYDSIDTKKTDLYSFTLEPSATGQIFFTKEQMMYDDGIHIAPFHKDFGEGHYEAGLADAYDATSRALRGSLEQLRVFHFNDTTINARIRRNTPISDQNYLRSDGGNIAAFLYKIRTRSDAYYSRILRYIRMIMPQFYDFVLSPDENDSINLNWRQNGAEEVFGPHQFSDGTLRFIALTTLLLQPPETSPSIIILDEPEIGLHPYAISILAKEIRMASKTSQIIVSTQSPRLLDHFSCNDIITAEYDATNRRSVLRRHSEVELKDWIANYSIGELWEKNVLGGLPL